ncbi:MAG TPA: hypothetical protein VGA93_02050 [Actinomycetota bacterium]
MPVGLTRSIFTPCSAKNAAASRTNRAAVGPRSSGWTWTKATRE